MVLCPASANRMIEIPLTRGFVAQVDLEDAYLTEHRWNVVIGKNDLRYAYSRKFGYMHRVIMGNPPGISIDHRNSNGLDNRRANLRIAGQSNNSAAARFKPNRAGYRGVHQHFDGRWRAQIKVHGKKKHLGLFATPADAARAYDAAAIEAFGEFARPNFTS